MNPMSHLAIIDTWDEIYHGYGNNEPIKYKSTLKKLLFIYEIYTPYDTIGDFKLNSVEYMQNTINDLDFYQYFKDRQMTFKIIKGKYNYKSRIFGIPNKSFDIFLKRVKQRYKQKIQRKKDVKNLLHRQINGKFKY